MAIATAATVFIIAVAYNQVIELFPSGGGGYKVATSLIGPYTGLVSGAALIVDYMLTIAISIASGVDAVFSFLPTGAQELKLGVEIAIAALLILLNLRGMRESIKILLPIFLGFFITHAVLILFGIGLHVNRLPTLLPDTLDQTSHLTQQFGWVFAASLFLRAYSLGGGTYTGIEAVSNNVQSLAEPRVRTGKWTMFYMAASLSFHGRWNHFAISALGRSAGGRSDTQCGYVSCHPRQPLYTITRRSAPLSLWYCCSRVASYLSQQILDFLVAQRFLPIWRSIPGCPISIAISQVVWSHSAESC